MIFGADVHDPKGSRKNYVLKKCVDFLPVYLSIHLLTCSLET